MLKDRMTHVDFTAIENGDRELSKLADSITVNSLVNFVENKLGGE
jgi:hypothetical protein